MCWSLEASVGMVVAGAAVTTVTLKRGEPVAIWGTMAYFTAMEALQVAGHVVIDDCTTPSNETVTMLSYLHIVFQPFFINWFAMELVPGTVKKKVRKWVFALCSVSAGVMLLQLAPLQFFGHCLPGSPLCGDIFCTVSGNWHIAWNIPYNGLMVPFDAAFGTNWGLPTYMISALLLPLIYGAWRFVVLNAVAGPILGSVLTHNPNELPAVWCFFSIAILCVGLSPLVRRGVETRTWWGIPVKALGG